MFKVVALLAIVGACSAGVLHAGLPLTYSTLGHQVVLPNAGLVADGRVASLRDAAALNSQIATQNAINNQGAVRNALLSGGVIAGAPTVYSAAPALSVIPNAGLVADGRITSLRDAAALNSQIATQNAINAGVLNTGAGVYYI